jgi:glycosyl transferase family 25
MAEPGLLELFGGVYVINLPERVDRRREMELELRRPGMGSGADVRFFPASWPEEAAPFNSRGTKGNFLSHLTILREAQAAGLDSVLVMEDDAEFEDHLVTSLPWLTRALSETAWGVIQLGYIAHHDVAPPGTAPSLWPFRGEVLGVHCYAVHRRAMGPLIAHLERQLVGTPGDDVYGPMSYDGSINTFGWVRSDVERQLAIPSLCRQRSSSSDVNPQRWDRVAGARAVADTARVVRRRIRRGLHAMRH